MGVGGGKLWRSGYGLAGLQKGILRAILPRLCQAIEGNRVLGARAS